jgi:hypothetical protein
MSSCPARKGSRNPEGREKELTLEERRVLRGLKLRRGIAIEALAVGFGVSYNTVRNVLKEPSLGEASQAEGIEERDDLPEARS